MCWIYLMVYIPCYEFMYIGLLNKDPAKRMDAEEAIYHVWTTSVIKSSMVHRCPILPVRIDNNSSNASSVEVIKDQIPCQTTLIPILDQIYGEDLENTLKDIGTLEDKKFSSQSALVRLSQSLSKTLTLKLK